MTILERTKEVARNRGMSLAEVSRKAGLSDKSIYRWQSASPRMETIQKVADVLNVSVDYLLGNTDEKYRDDDEIIFRRKTRDFTNDLVRLDTSKDENRQKLIADADNLLSVIKFANVTGITWAIEQIENKLTDDMSNGSRKISETLITSLNKALDSSNTEKITIELDEVHTARMLSLSPKEREFIINKSYGYVEGMIDIISNYGSK